MSFAGYLVRRLSFCITLAADDRFVSQATAEVVQGRAGGNDLLRLALMGCEQGSELTVSPIQQGSQIGVTQEGSLGMRLFAEANRFAPQARLRFHPIDDRLNISAGAQIQHHGHQVSVAGALVAGRRVIEANRQPDGLAVTNRVARAQMLLDHFENHVGTELADALAAEAGEILADAVRPGIFQGFVEHGREARAERVYFEIDRWASRGCFFLWLTAPC